jgi:hypothetical protein
MGVIVLTLRVCGSDREDGGEEEENEATHRNLLRGMPEFCRARRRGARSVERGERQIRTAASRGKYRRRVLTAMERHP